MPPPINELLDAHGFAIVTDVLPAQQIEKLKAALSKQVSGNRERYLLEFSEVFDLALDKAVRQVVCSACGPECHAVAATLFDKLPSDNWLVPRHQDVNIAVAERYELPGFGAWSMKQGVHHVQPPVAVLEKMIAVRLHLDSVDETNGVLRVLPGSHKHGRLNEAALSGLDISTELALKVPAGAAILMRPLLVHSSAKSVSSRRRRVIHFEYTSTILPPPLRWKFWV